MIGFWLINLLIPSDPEELSMTTSSGNWTITKCAQFLESKNAISRGECAHTYSLENPVSMKDGAAACDACLEDMAPILLGMSYLSGLSVTVKLSLPHSDISILQPTRHWPRERSIGKSNCCVTNETEYIEVLKKFIAAWLSNGQFEKALLLIHHWLDALGCWSFEDFYLSATTLLQIIAATQEKTAHKELNYFPAIQLASERAGIKPLSRDFKDMRNNLIHEGKLLGGAFSGTDINACSAVAADLMNWFDEYIHAVLSLGPVKRQRYKHTDFAVLNAYSL